MHLRNLAWWGDFFSCRIKFEIEIILLNMLCLSFFVTLFMALADCSAHLAYALIQYF